MTGMLASSLLLSQFYLSTSIAQLCLAIYAFASWLKGRRKNRFDVPIIGSELGNAEKRRVYYFDHAPEMLQTAYTKFKDRICLINQTEASVALLPQELLVEAMTKYRHALDLNEVGRRSMCSDYTRLELGFNAGRAVIKSKLNPNLGTFVRNIVEEGDDALNTELPHSTDWTSIKIYDRLAHTVARMSARVFVGPELCRSEDWLKINIDYATDIAKAARAIRRWNPWLRPLVYRFLPEVRRAWKYQDDSVRFMSPIMCADETGFKSSQGPTLWSWFYEVMDEKQKRDIAYQARLQLTLSFVGIHTTTAFGTHVLYDLAAYPEYAPILRTEIQEVLQKHGGFSKQALYDMKRLDSFMKESQRLSPLGRVTPRRVVDQSITLSDGTTIPKGFWIGFNGHGFQRDEEHFPNPNQFDGLRFYKLRHPEGNGNQLDPEAERKHQLVCVSPSSFNFGLGEHACPGRFFAATELKILVALILLKYDVKLPEGQGRPENLDYGGQVAPDATKDILLKRIES